jgi:hypothetical protein
LVDVSKAVKTLQDSAVRATESDGVRIGLLRVLMNLWIAGVFLTFVVIRIIRSNTAQFIFEWLSKR